MKKTFQYFICFFFKFIKNQSSFDNIRAWLSEIKQYAEDDVIIMLLGNKLDKANRVITKEQGEKLAKVII